MSHDIGCCISEYTIPEIRTNNIIDMNIQEFCELAKITERQFYGTDVIYGNIDLSRRQLTSIPDGFNPTLTGALNLSFNQLTTLPKGFNPTTGADLNLSYNCLNKLNEEFSPVSVSDLNLSYNNLTRLNDRFNPATGGSLILSHNQLSTIPNRFNPTTFFNLDLSYNKLSALPKEFNPTTGGNLDLSDNQLTSLHEEFKPTIGGNLRLDNNPKGLITTVTPLPSKHLFSWQDGRYIKADGLFTKVINHKVNMWIVSEIGSNKSLYLITDGVGNYAHGDTLKQAKNDLIYKRTERNNSNYEYLNLDSTLSFKEMIKCYRSITGACTTGTRGFVEHMLGTDKKKNYTIAEVIELSRNHYGGEAFRVFFRRKQ